MSKRQKASGPSPRADKPMEDEIRALAYQLYCEGGNQDGRDCEYWLEAEQQVIARSKSHLRRVA